MKIQITVHNHVFLQSLVTLLQTYPVSWQGLHFTQKPSYSLQCLKKCANLCH